MTITATTIADANFASGRRSSGSREVKATAAPPPAGILATPEPTMKRPTKSDAVVKLLSRAKGATMPELASATAWQPHSIRAHLSGLRKKGSLLLREPRKDGEQAYRLASSAVLDLEQPKPPVQTPKSRVKAAAAPTSINAATASPPSAVTPVSSVIA